MRRTLLLLAALGVAACTPSHSGSQGEAPSFELSDIQGNRVSLASYRGKIVMLDFWATWCGPCRYSIPTVQDFYTKHKDQGLVVLGINIDEDPIQVPEFVRTFGMTYPVLLAGSSNVAQQYNVAGIPHFVFIDTSGQVIQHFQGFSPRMAEEWETLLAQMGAAKAR